MPDVPTGKGGAFLEESATARALPLFPDLLLFVDRSGVVRNFVGGTSGAFAVFADGHGRALTSLIPRGVATEVVDALREGRPAGFEFVAPAASAVHRFEARVVGHGSECVVVRDLGSPAPAPAREHAPTEFRSPPLPRLLDELDTGILVESEDRRIHYANRSFCRIFEIDALPEELVGIDYSSVANAAVSLVADPATFFADIEKCIATGCKSDVRRLELVDGRVFEWDYTPFPPDSGFSGHLWQYRDVTDRVEAGQALHAAERRLREVQKREAVGRVAGAVAHEFNNDLTAILGFVELLLAREGLDPDVRERLDGIRGAGLRASSLTQQLLSFSRRRVLQPCILDLNGVLEVQRGLLSRLLGSGTLEVHTESEPMWVRFDPGEIEHVLMNLVLNARDALSDNGCVRIETRREGATIVLLVQDDGVGMDEETVARIFEPFFTTKGIGEGTGLGLAIVKDVVTDAGGRVAVTSKLGQGTTFRIELPARDRPEGSEAPARVGDRVRGRESVLVVEDEDSIRDLVAEILHGNGYRSRSAVDAREALEAIETGPPPDIVLSDVVLPGMRGSELAVDLRERLPGVPILLFSGHSTNAELRALLADPAIGFVSKPFTPSALLGAIRGLLDR